jgi:hypothetical protein
MHYLITDETCSLDALTGLLGKVLGPLHRFESRYLGGHAARGHAAGDQAARAAGVLIRPNLDMLSGGPYREDSPEARFVVEFDQPPADELLSALSSLLRESRIGFRFVDDPAAP